MAPAQGPLGAPLVDVGASLDQALDAWAKTVQPRVKEAVRKLSAPQELAQDTRAWVKAKAPAARRSLHAVQDNARDVAQSRSLTEAGGKLRAIGRRLYQPLSAAARQLGRVLVCCFFLNLTWENVGLYHYYKQQYDAQPRGGGAPFAPVYPWLSVLVVAPTALLCALGIRTRLTASILTLDMLKEDADMIYHGISGLIRAGTRPNELLVKKVSVLGCIVLVLAGAGGATSASAGVVAGMLTDERATPLASRRKSAALLLGRLMLSALFVYVGTGQMARLRTRSTMWSHIVDPTDGHDNLWLILQFALSLPFAAGFKTRSVTLGLAASLAAEAATCWRFWRYRADAQRGAWALGKYIHARSHFATNMAVAGGLLLLTGGGAGRYTVDAMLSKKRE